MASFLDNHVNKNNNSKKGYKASNPNSDFDILCHYSIFYGNPAFYMTFKNSKVLSETAKTNKKKSAVKINF